MNLVDNSGWYALVKYKSGNETEVLPIQKIKLKIGKGERVSFNPKSLTDFDRMKFHTVNTTHGSKDGREHKWYAHIGLLAESREALESAMARKRISWPIVLDGDQSEPNTTDNDNAVLEEGNLTITSNRDSNKNKKKTKKQATDAVHAKLLASRSLYESSTTHAPVTADDDITCLLRENAELKSALQAEQKKNIPGEVREDQNIANILRECLQRIEAKVEKIQDQFQRQYDSVGKANMEKLAELEGKMTKIEDWMRMRPPSLVSSASLVSSSNASSDTEEKVPLGDGVFCSKAAYSKLINVEESHADWAYALLKGVFGDKAHRMRVQISSKCSENEKFSQNFLMVDKFLHRDWLIKQTIRDNSGQLHSKYSPAEVEKYVNALPAYLADRAYDMQGGPRGANVRNAPERRRSESTAPKRNYKRRGQPLSSQQLPQQLSHQDPISSEPSSLQQYQDVNNLQSQQQPPQQSSHHDPISSQLLLQLYQDVDNLQTYFLTPPRTSEAGPMGFQHAETTATTYTNL